MSDRTVLVPERLLDVESGELLADRAVVVEGDRIVAVVGAGDAPVSGVQRVDLAGQTLLPGLVDCH
ncbi:MAG TPA: amidohydrolase family protein, partial [Actinomycetes bacterium]